jgi:hypothetical protein
MDPVEYDTFNSKYNFSGCSVRKLQISWFLALIKHE